MSAFNPNFRQFWGIIAFISLFFIALSHIFFQQYLFMRPCANCVYIRFALFIIAFGAIFALISPRIFRFFGMLFLIYGEIFGIKYALLLNDIHKALKSDDIFGVVGCDIVMKFPFGIEFDKLFAPLFAPTGNCGDDAPVVPRGEVLSDLQAYFVDLYQNGWYLVPKYQFIDMAQGSLIIFALIAIFALCGIVSRMILKLGKFF